MGIFRRRRDRFPATDPDARKASDSEASARDTSVLDDSQSAEALVRMIIDVLESEFSRRAQMASDGASVIVGGPQGASAGGEGADELSLGLANIMRKARHTDPAGWREMLVEHFEPLLRDQVEVSSDELTQRIIVRITNPEHEGAATFDYAPTWIDPFRLVLAADFPDCVRAYPDAQIGVADDLDKWYRMAWANLRRELDGAELSCSRLGQSNGVFVDVISGQCYHLATAALLLSEYLPKWYPGTDLSGGVLFSVPNRYSMVLRPARQSMTVGDLSAIAEVTFDRWCTEVSPVSPHVYFWHMTPDAVSRRAAGDIDDVEWDPRVGPYFDGVFFSRAGRVMQLTDWDANGGLQFVRAPRIVTFG